MSYLGTNKIGKMYLGNTEIAKAYLGSDLVFQKGGAQPVMIPYIRGGADGSYIDTGITADSTTRVIVWARNFNPNSTVLFGSRIGGTDKTFGVFAPGLQFSGALRFDYGSTQNVIPDAFTKMSGYHKYELNGANFYVDDVLLGAASVTTFENSLNIYLFAINTNGTRNDSAFPIDICACQIYKNGALVRDYTAVNTPSVGLYDAVSDTVFTNSGSGSFSYGTFNPQAYTPLDYIESSGAQYIDAGIKGGGGSNVVLAYMPNESENYPALFGAQTSSSSKRFGVYFSVNSNIVAKNLTYAYDSNSTSYSSSETMNGNKYVATIGSGTLTIYSNNEKIGTITRTNATFATDYNLYIGAFNLAGTAGQYSSSRFYYFGYNGTHSFVPAKMNNIAGLYDTYNDVFLSSETGTDFLPGNEI